MLKLYTSDASPFGSRVLIALRAKQIEIEKIHVSGEALKMPDYLAINPIGRMPVLLDEQGLAVPESETILRYLEDRYPDPSLQPASPADRARINTLIRMTDNYVMAPVIRLFAQLDPAKRDPATVLTEVDHWKNGLAAIAHFMVGPLPTAPAGLTLADCVLPPSLHLSQLIAGMLDLRDLLASHPVLADYYRKMRNNPVVGCVLDDLDRAQASH